jgi:hypothetical protein
MTLISSFTANLQERHYDITVRCGDQNLYSSLHDTVPLPDVLVSNRALRDKNCKNVPFVSFRNTAQHAAPQATCPRPNSDICRMQQNAE